MISEHKLIPVCFDSKWMACDSFLLFLSFSADPKGNYEQMPFMTDASRWPQFRAGEYGNWDALLIQYIAIWSLRFFRLLSLVTLHELGLCSGLAGLTVIDKLQGDSVNYVNIPISPTSKRQLHYMELDLQDHPESSHTVRGTLCSSQYILHISWPQRQKKTPRMCRLRTKSAFIWSKWIINSDIVWYYYN